MIAKWEGVIGVEVAGWGVKQMKTRWGQMSIHDHLFPLVFDA